MKAVIKRKNGMTQIVPMEDVQPMSHVRNEVLELVEYLLAQETAIPNVSRLKLIGTKKNKTYFEEV